MSWLFNHPLTNKHMTKTKNTTHTHTQDVSDAIEGGAGISQAVAAADAAHPEAPTTIDKMLDIAEEDPTTLGRLLTTPKVGAFERAEAGEGIGVPGPLRRGSIPVSASAEPGAVIEDSLLKGKVGDHTETSYFEAIQKAFAALMKDAAEAKAAAGGKEEEEERA